MKITKFGKYIWDKLNLITLDDEKRGWYYIPKETVAAHEESLKRPGWPQTKLPRKTKVIYKEPGTRTFIVNEPRLPMFATILHQHGTHKSEVNEEFKCLRCGKDVPEVVKSLVMMEHLKDK